MKVLITGRGGQLASELANTAPNNIKVFSLDSKDLDITDIAKINKVVSEVNPDIIINAAAYTAVDKAESEKELAYSVNAIGTENLAKVCSVNNIGLIHISTDFVFNGNACQPYLPTDETAPISVYGDTKLQGEHKLLSVMPFNAIIIRTAWVYSKFGNNFVKTMLRLMQERDKLNIVYDQIGTPTWADGLARMIWGLIENRFITKPIQQTATNILHWTDAGVTSWYDFAVAIQELAFEQGILKNKIPIRPILASEYPTPAKRPNYSVLDKTEAERQSKINTIHWQKQLKNMLKSNL
ncbi:dTDP-4-dehydrorhamnose reductase [Shewanella donghaensis]|uniref:dTDP-4-dehydrorhamnose reductase n=1 Tax=Shewanella donghaensis TaxID=238836 RepID=UPI0011843B69|nr:dTDP-4-dehydrorhamnose reductase [Shewanella donghaensis]